VKAAFFRLPGEVQWRQTEGMRPGAGEVLVRILASGICGSDDYAYRTGKGLEGQGPSDWRRRGHEYAGRVVEVAPDVKGLSGGDMVSGIGSLPCGTCDACAGGEPALCAAPRWCGGEGFSEYLCKGEEWFYPIGDLTAEQGAVMEPLTVAIEMARDAGVGPGSNVLIIGAGPIGLMAIGVCKRSGAGRVYVSHPSHSRARLEAAGQLGADHVFLSDRDDVVGGIRREHPRGLDSVLVTAPPSAGVPLAEAACGLGGRIALVGMANEPSDTIRLNIDRFHFKKLSLVGSNHNPCSRLYPAAAEMLRGGDVDAARIVSHRFPLERIREAFDFATSQRAEVVKVLLCQGDDHE
jgi:L-iditol 2-dehydrogenase